MMRYPGTELLEQRTLASRFGLLGHFAINKCEVSNFAYNLSQLGLPTSNLSLKMLRFQILTSANLKIAKVLLALAT